MHSSFLTWVNAGLAFYSTILFLKLIIQFGLPNHPSKFTAYVISLCVSGFLLMESATAFGLIAPMVWMKWRALPLVCGSLGILFQSIMTSGHVGYLQQKVFSRMPLIIGLVCFAYFPSKADLFLIISLTAGFLFLTIAVGKARYQKRLFFKMCLFLILTLICRAPDLYWTFVLGQLSLFLALFYFYVFEHTFGISALVERFDNEKGISQ